MAIPILPPEQLAQLSELVAEYITTQRNRYAPKAVLLSTQQRAAMAGFFNCQQLNDTRLLVLSGERVANPDFYPMLEELTGVNYFFWRTTTILPYQRH